MKVVIGVVIFKTALLTLLKNMFRLLPTDDHELNNTPEETSFNLRQNVCKIRRDYIPGAPADCLVRQCCRTGLIKWTWTTRQDTDIHVKCVVYYTAKRGLHKGLEKAR
jgi:hypothetical protein